MIDGGDDELVLFQAQAELVTALVIAAIAAAVAALFGQPDWATTLAIAVMSLVLGAIVLPIGETVYCLMTRKLSCLRKPVKKRPSYGAFLNRKRTPEKHRLRKNSGSGRSATC